MQSYLLAQFGPAAPPIETIIARGAAENMTDEQFLAKELLRWIDSPQRREQLDGERYYRGKHDILERRREAIGEGGQLIQIDNLPNNRIVDNQYAKMVDQKVDYLLGKPFVLQTENDTYQAALDDIFCKPTRHMLHDICADSLRGGVAWLHPYYDETGALKLRRFPAYEILPFWRDAEHTVLDLAIRLYASVVYEGQSEAIVQRVEVYSTRGVQRYILSGGKLLPDPDYPSTAHAAVKGADGQAQPLNWQRVPLVAVKYNAQEIPLIRMVKSLQDAINLVRSDWQNRTQEDIHSTILVLKNYDGTDLGAFRRNLALYGAVKVRSETGGEGGVDTLAVEVNVQNFEAILKALKRSLIENARGFDAKDDRLGGNPNEMNLRSMYSDIDLDADGMEAQLQFAFEQLFWFIDNHFVNKGIGNFANEEVEIKFDRNMIVNESQIIIDVKNSVGIVSDETLLAKHPYVSDPQAELERKKRQDEAEREDMSQYKQAFGDSIGAPEDGGRDET